MRRWLGLRVEATYWWALLVSRFGHWWCRFYGHCPHTAWKWTEQPPRMVNGFTLHSITAEPAGCVCDRCGETL